MLGLKLRAEFLSAQMPGTQIALQDYVDGNADRILAITYPTADVRNALWAISATQSQPVVLIGDRGRGKSHIMAVLHAAFRQPALVQDWAKGWASGKPRFRMRRAARRSGSIRPATMRAVLYHVARTGRDWCSRYDPLPQPLYRRFLTASRSRGQRCLLPSAAT